MCKDYLITLTTKDNITELSIVKSKGVAFHMITYFEDIYKEGKIEMIELKRKRLKVSEIIK